MLVIGLVSECSRKMVSSVIGLRLTRSRTPKNLRYTVSPRWLDLQHRAGNLAGVDLAAEEIVDPRQLRRRQSRAGGLVERPSPRAASAGSKAKAIAANDSSVCRKVIIKLSESTLAR